MPPAACLVFMLDWQAWLARLEFWRGYEGELTTLGLYGVGIGIYGILVFTLLNTVSKRQPFASRKPRPGAWWATLRGLRWLFLFPLFAFAYFLMIAVSLFFLAKAGETETVQESVQRILLISVSVVAGIRISAWFSEPAAREIAKLVPLALLGVLIVEPGYSSVNIIWERFRELPVQFPLLGRYLLALFLVELAAKPVLALWKMKDGGDDDDDASSDGHLPIRRVPVKAGKAPQVGVPKDKRL